MVTTSERLAAAENKLSLHEQEKQEREQVYMILVE